MSTAKMFQVVFLGDERKHLLNLNLFDAPFIFLVCMNIDRVVTDIRIMPPLRKHRK